MAGHQVGEQGSFFGGSTAQQDKQTFTETTHHESQNHMMLQLEGHWHMCSGHESHGLTFILSMLYEHTNNRADILYGSWKSFLQTQLA